MHISVFCNYFVRYPLNREGALKVIVDALKDRDVVVGTTGMLSRELFEYRVAKGHGHEKDFLTVGSMGHASAIALGIAQFRPKRQVLLLIIQGPFLSFSSPVLVKSSFNEEGLITQKRLFQEPRNSQSNDQCVMWYSFMKFILICCTGLYRL